MDTDCEGLMFGLSSSCWALRDDFFFFCSSGEPSSVLRLNPFFNELKNPFPFPFFPFELAGLSSSSTVEPWSSCRGVVLEVFISSTKEHLRRDFMQVAHRMLVGLLTQGRLFDLHRSHYAN